MSNLKKAKQKLSSVSKVQKEDNKEIRVTVEEIENGFLIIKNIEWRDKDGYQYKTEKTFSATDPFASNEKNKTLSEIFS